VPGGGDQYYKLTRTRQALLEQVDGLLRAANESAHDLKEHLRWGMSSSEMANFTAADILAASLDTGIAAAKEALNHTSQILQVEFLYDLRALDIFPNEMFWREW
jgi:hypothetical protein